jgi:hypothetical protein
MNFTNELAVRHVHHPIEETGQQYDKLLYYILHLGMEQGLMTGQ